MESEIEKSISLIDLYKELKKIEQRMVTKEEFNVAFETLSILTNEETMEQIEKSEEDIRKGRIKKVESINEI